jgi:hypothetical protein
MIRNFIYKLYFVIGAIFIISGCAVIKPNNQNIETREHRHLKHLTPKKYLTYFNENYPNYKNLQLKFKLKFEDSGSTKSLKGVIKNRRDSIILIYLYHSTGIPIAKIKLTQDSVFLDDRLNKKFYADDYNFINSKFLINLTYDNVEALLFARPFIYGDTVFSDKKFKDFKRYKDSTYFVFRSTRNKKIKKFYKKTKKGKKIPDRLVPSLIVQSFYVDRNTIDLSRSVVQDLLNGYTFSAEYNDYGNVLDDKKFVKKIDITLNNKKNLYKFHLKYYRVIEKSNLKYNFKVPDYKDE